MISLPVLAGGVLFFIIKKRRTSLFLNLFGRKNADLEFFDLQLFIMPKKLGFYYKGRLPWRMQRYGICDVQEQAETKIVCRIGTAEDKIDTKREKFDAILSRAGGVELSIIKAKKNRVFDVWLKVGSGGKKEKIPVALRKQETTLLTARKLIQAAAKSAAAVKSTESLIV